MTLVATDTISGIDVEIHAISTGRWEIRESGSPGHIGWSESLDNAKQQARAALAKRKVKVSVAFVTHAGERGVATGIHTSNRSILARVDGTSMQLQNYSALHVFRPDIDEKTLDRYLDLEQKRRQMAREADEIEKQWTLDLRKAVERAIAEKVEAQASSATTSREVT